MKMGIVIPAYNAGDRLQNVLSKTQKFISKNRICVVDDGSSDSTSAVAREVGCVILRHPINRGKGRALQTGFRWATQEHLDCIITMDGDGQHDPVHIPEFTAVMDDSGCDIVLGLRRFQVGVMPLDRICSNVLSSLIVSWVSGKRILDSQCGYLLLSHSIFENIRLTSSYFEAESEILGFTHCDVGSYLVQKWNFPIELGKVIYYHHRLDEIDPESMDTFQVKTIALVDIANQMMHRLGIGYRTPVEKLDLTKLESLQLINITLEEEHVNDLLERVKDSIEEEKGKF